MTAITADVALCCYNDANTLKRTIESVLSQEALGTFYIVDDGSTDHTASILAELDHTQISVHKNIKNLGLAASLNHVLQISTSKYLARIDADDEMAPGRLKKQIEFMEHNHHVHVLGTNALCFDKSAVSATNVPLTFEVIRKKLMRYNCVLHPTVMLRTQFIIDVGGYDTSYKRSQDYELWLRLLKNGGFIYNLECVLTIIHVRRHKTWNNIISEFSSVTRIAKKHRAPPLILYANYSFIFNLLKFFSYKILRKNG
jgi:glycosyltransferase EpsE